jgi:hypothetical protein
VRGNVPAAARTGEIAIGLGARWQGSGRPGCDGRAAAASVPERRSIRLAGKVPRRQRLARGRRAFAAQIRPSGPLEK